MLGVVVDGGDAAAGEQAGGSPGSTSGGKTKGRHQRTSGRPVHLLEPMDHPWVAFAR